MVDGRGWKGIGGGAAIIGASAIVDVVASMTISLRCRFRGFRVLGKCDNLNPNILSEAQK